MTNFKLGREKKMKPKVKKQKKNDKDINLLYFDKNSICKYCKKIQLIGICNK